MMLAVELVTKSDFKHHVVVISTQNYYYMIQIKFEFGSPSCIICYGTHSILMKKHRSH